MHYKHKKAGSQPFRVPMHSGLTARLIKAMQWRKAANKRHDRSYRNANYYRYDRYDKTGKTSFFFLSQEPPKN